jgi:MFS family permease
MGLRRYRELLSIPGVPPLLIAAFVARLPYGLFALALILLLRAQGFDYAAIGVVTAASGFSIGVAAPVLGRVIDRVGQTRVLVTTAGLGAVTGVGLLVAALAGAGTAVLTLLALAAGLTVPPVSPSLRTLLPGLVGRERLDTAFAFDALQLECVFIS